MSIHPVSITSDSVFVVHIFTVTLHSLAAVTHAKSTDSIKPKKLNKYERKYKTRRKSEFTLEITVAEYINNINLPSFEDDSLLGHGTMQFSRGRRSFRGAYCLQRLVVDSALKLEAINTSEMAVYYKTVRRHIPEDLSFSSVP